MLGQKVRTRYFGVLNFDSVPSMRVHTGVIFVPYLCSLKELIAPRYIAVNTTPLAGFEIRFGYVRNSASLIVAADCRYLKLWDDNFRSKSTQSMKRSGAIIKGKNFASLVESPEHRCCFFY